MEIIPVIDLKGGLVVRARLGERASYRPIVTPLASSSDACDVIAGLLTLYPFRALYIADLDAIEGTGSSETILDGIALRFPALNLWVDNGCREQGTAERFLEKRMAASLVLGSESQVDTRLVQSLCRQSRMILSLDFRGNDFVGPESLLAEAQRWPDRVIIMSLARIGSDVGPDFARFEGVKQRAGSRRLYLAGGVRNRDDLAAAKARRAAGILVASALHDGRLTADDLAKLDGGESPG